VLDLLLPTDTFPKLKALVFIVNLAAAELGEVEEVFPPPQDMATTVVTIIRLKRQYLQPMILVATIPLLFKKYVRSSREPGATAEW